MGIHYVIAQLIGNLAVLLLMSQTKDWQEIYYHNVIMLTGITGLITMIPAIFFYRRDRIRRIEGGLIQKKPKIKLTLWEIVLLLLVGAGLSQYVNIFVGILQIYLKSDTYQQSMAVITADQSIWVMALWMGIVAPVAEEMIFRWLIYLRLRDSMGAVGAGLISAAIFGIYHGNILQAIYAGILGYVFAYLLELSGSLWTSVCLHIGANLWSLAISNYGAQLQAKAAAGTLLGIYMVLLVVTVAGVAYFIKKGSSRARRMI